MNHRLIALVCAALVPFVGVAAPLRQARAQESAIELVRRAPVTWVTADGSPELRHRLAIARMHADSAVPFQLDPPMKEVRLSQGAKTAIIITAIVVGALIIVGAVALSKPGKKLP